MHRVWLPCVLLGLMVSGCATIDVKLKQPPVVAPDQRVTLNDSKWTIKSEPR